MLLIILNIVSFCDGEFFRLLLDSPGPQGWLAISAITAIHDNQKGFLMVDSLQPQTDHTPAILVASNEDQFGEQRGLGVSVIAFKVTPKDSDDVFIIENTFHAKGGPARHLHYNQDEWFYVVEGEFVLEAGQEKFTLHPGDSVLAPRKVPHVWAFTGSERGRILISFLPAGKMESFFREVTKANAMPPQDPELWRSHGMELLGPPLKV